MSEVYRFSAQEARERGELLRYRASMRENEACRRAIEDAIRQNYANNHLNEQGAVDVLNQYDSERVNYVLAATIIDHDYDGRYSRSNKAWAKAQGIVKNENNFGNNLNAGFMPTSHPVLLNSFTSQVRTIEFQREEKLQCVEVFGIPGLFSNGRIPRNDVPKELFAYDLRGSDYDPGQPVTIEEYVSVNHAGTVLLSQEPDFGKSKYLRLGDWESDDYALNYLGEEMTVQEFCEKQMEQSLPEPEIEDEDLEPDF